MNKFFSLKQKNTEIYKVGKNYYVLIMFDVLFIKLIILTSKDLKW